MSSKHSKLPEDYTLLLPTRMKVKIICHIAVFALLLLLQSLGQCQNRQALERKLNDIQAYQRHCKLSDHYFDSGDFQKAVPELRSAIRLHSIAVPNNNPWSLHAMLGISLYNLKLYKEAIPHLSYASAHSRGGESYQILVAKSHEKYGDSKSALKVWKSLQSSKRPEVLSEVKRNLQRLRSSQRK